MRLLKFLTTGLVGISVNLTVFHLLYIAGVPYLIGSAFGLLVAMSVTFTMQKFWTFQDHARAHAGTQFVAYLLLGLANLALNSGIVYVLVSRFQIWYLLAQSIGAIVVAADSFFIYRTYIFRSANTSAHPMTT